MIDQLELCTESRATREEYRELLPIVFLLFDKEKTSPLTSLGSAPSDPC
jgi:hypothetical protein